MKRGQPPPLGGISVDEFMRRYWQREPLLVRNAFPDLVPPVMPPRLFELAASDEAQSRLVTATGKRWTLTHGPFDPDSLPPLDRRRWTLLVQGVDTLDDEARALLDRFRFVADARLDDLMISFATDGGGVGPHVDSYDVFLIQAHGRRRWRVGPPCPDDFLPGLPLKILADFRPDREWVLEPGDMLYLPPRWSHDGVASGHCMTYSVGFRAPSRHELLRAFLADSADLAPGGPDARFADPAAPAARHPARIPDDMHATLQAWLAGWRPSAAQVDDFIGRYLTEPKPSVWFEGPARQMSPEAFLRAASTRGITADRRTRMNYRGRRLFINGESCVMPAGLANACRRLADDRALPPEAFAVDAAPLAALLHDWYDAGWLALGARAGAARAARRVK